MYCNPYRKTTVSRHTTGLDKDTKEAFFMNINKNYLGSHRRPCRQLRLYFCTNTGDKRVIRRQILWKSPTTSDIDRRISVPPAEVGTFTRRMIVRHLDMFMFAIATCLCSTSRHVYVRHREMFMLGIATCLCSPSRHVYVRHRDMFMLYMTAMFVCCPATFV